MSKQAWAKEKQKAAAFIHLSKSLGGKQIVHQTMKRDWYRHIDKVLAGKATNRDARHWHRIEKKFKKSIAGVPSKETEELMQWLNEFKHRVRRGEINKKDMKKWLPQFRSYMEDSEKNYSENYIIQNKLME